MELWKVTVEYADVTGARFQDLDTATYKQHTTYVALYGEFGSEQIRLASEKAIDSVVGEDAGPEWQAWVVAAEHLGSVNIVEYPTDDKP